MAALLEVEAAMDSQRSDSIMKDCSIDQRIIDSSAEIFPDRLSNLPDFVLLHILSFLPTDLVARTSCLSKRWRDLWASVPGICLSTLRNADVCVRFMERLLAIHDGSNIRKFEVIAPRDVDHKKQVNAWIAFVVRHNIERLYLSCEDYDDQDTKYYETPHCIFNCRSLVSLSLTCCYLNMPASMYLPSLRTLYLQKVYLSGDTMKDLTSSCPFLEDLTLEECNWDVSLNIFVANSRLRSFTLKECVDLNYLDINIEIFAPSILSLKLDDGMARESYHVKSLSSLVVASFDLESMWDVTDSWWETMLSRFTSFVELLDQIHHVKVLELCSWCLMNLSLRESQGLATTVSYNITALEFHTGLGKSDIPGIAYMLRNFISLEVLIVDVGEDRSDVDEEYFLRDFGYDETKYWNSGELSFSVILQHLKSIKIRNFMGSRRDFWKESSEVGEEIFKNRENEVEFVRFLLKNSTVLETLTIITTNLPNLPERKSELLCKLTSRLLNLPRASPTARLCISDK